MVGVSRGASHAHASGPSSWWRRTPTTRSATSSAWSARTPARSSAPPPSPPSTASTRWELEKDAALLTRTLFQLGPGVFEPGKARELLLFDLKAFKALGQPDMVYVSVMVNVQTKVEEME